MNILHVTPYFAPAWSYGGPPQAVYEIAREQVRAGHSITVLTTTAFNETTLPAGVIKMNGINVIRLPNLSNWLIWKYHFSTPLGLSSHISNTRQRFDIIHLHEVRTLLNYFVLLQAAQQTPVILSPWGTLPHNDNMVIIKKLIDIFLIPLLRKHVCIGFGQTNHEVKELAKWKLGVSQVLIPLGVSSSDFKVLPTKAQSRKKMDLDQNSTVFLFLGRFSAYKGIDFLIQAFKKLLVTNQKAVLLLVGRDDGYLSAIRQLIGRLKLERKVIVTGPAYGEDRLFAYKAADVFVFVPSVYEETGTVCLEALSTSLPVITTKQAAIPYLTASDGVIQIKRTEKALLSAMKAICQKSIKVKRKKVLRYFSWSNITKRMLDQYQQP